MPAVTFDNFAGGLDVRPASALSKPNILRRLRNAYVTTGKAIRKRGCLQYIATLEPGTVGLKAFGGKLNTFYGHAAAITHADTRFVARRVPHVTTGAAPTKIHYADQYQAQLYVAAEYGDGTFRHHYLDPGSTASPVWLTGTVYAANAFVTPSVPNGFRYEVTAGGGGMSGGAEPVWPVAIGGTVADGPLTWTCRTFSVTDAACPHTKQVAKQASKMYAVGTDATTVRYCKTGDARDWSAASDAGFIPAGLNARGSDQVTSINIFSDKRLAVFFSDNAQLWSVDPSPSNISLTSNIEGVGTLFHRACGPVSSDLFFLAQTGYRSMSLTAITNNLQDADVGSAVDKLVRASVDPTDDPLAIYYPKAGQFWSINGDLVWAYSFSRTAKISAWSEFNLPLDAEDACVLNQDLYIRSGDDVFKVTEDVYKDWTSNIPLVDIEMFYQDGKKPGVLKQWSGMDVIGKGTPTISLRFDAANETLETGAYEYPAITEPGALYPVELQSTRIAPHIVHQKDEEFEISQLSLYFDDLGLLA